MKSPVAKLISTLIALGGAATFSSACSETGSTLFIQQVQAITVDGECTVTNDPEAAHIGRGMVDLRLATSYDAVLLVGNQLVARGNEDTLRPETSRVQLYEAEVEVFDLGGGQLQSFTVPISGFTDVGRSSNAAYGLADVTLLDATVLDRLRNGGQDQIVVSRVKVFGLTLGGEEVESGAWDFPIQVCSACSANFCIEPASCEDDIVAHCSGEAGQDGALPDCRSIAGTDPGTTASVRCP